MDSAAAPATRRNHHAVGGDRAAGGGAHAALVHSGHCVANHDLGAGALAGGDQRRHHREWVHLVVLRRQDAAGAARREAGLEPPAFARRQPLRVEPQRALERVQAPQLLGVIAVHGDHQRSRAAVVELPAEVVREARPELGRGEVEPEQRLRAKLGLGDRGEHARRGRGCAGGRTVPIEHEHRQSPLGRAPRGCQAHQARADHYGVVLASLRHCAHSKSPSSEVAPNVPTPELPGSGSTVGGDPAALSARFARAPVGPRNATPTRASSGRGAAAGPRMDRAAPECGRPRAPCRASRSPAGDADDDQDQTHRLEVDPGNGRVHRVTEQQRQRR